MEQNEFKDVLAREGFSEVVLVEREANGKMDVHTHPFEAKALVLEGDLKIREANMTRTYVKGEIFHLQKEREHEEWYGPQGVRYMVGRKADASSSPR